MFCSYTHIRVYTYSRGGVLPGKNLGNPLRIKLMDSNKKKWEGFIVHIIEHLLLMFSV